MNLVDEFNVKIARMKEYLIKKGAECVVLCRADNFAWATCGGNSYVNIAEDRGTAAFLLIEDRAIVIVNNVEKKRLAEEELKGLPIDVYGGPWQIDLGELGIDNYVKGKRTLSDVPFSGLDILDDDFKELTYEMTATELIRYRSLGARTGVALQEACGDVKQGMSELEVAGALALSCIKRGVTPIVALVAADERISKYRHPLPTEKKIEKTVMVVVCGRRKGLIASCTRMVSIGEPAPELAEKHAACVFVDVVMNLNTHVGQKVSQIYELAREAYVNSGYQGEWNLHHQGGPTGYQPRYYKATEKSEGVVAANTAYAWNPSITGTKSEDTIIVLEDRNEIITQAPDWPMIEIETPDVTIERPDILVV